MRLIAAFGFGGLALMAFSHLSKPDRAIDGGVEQASIVVRCFIDDFEGQCILRPPHSDSFTLTQVNGEPFFEDVTEVVIAEVDLMDQGIGMTAKLSMRRANGALIDKGSVTRHGYGADPCWSNEVSGVCIRDL